MAIEMAKGKHLERTKRIYVMLYCNRSPFFLFYQSATTRQSYFTIFGKIIGRSSLSSENLGYLDYKMIRVNGEKVSVLQLPYYYKLQNESK